MILVSIDEVDLDSARVWCENTLSILDVLRRRAEKLPFRIPPEALLAMEEIVSDWLADVRSGKRPRARGFSTDELRQLILYWFNVTKLTEDDRSRLGITFAPPEGRAFADALARKVGEVLFASDELVAFAQRLEDEWRDCQPAFAAAPLGR